MQTRYTRIRRWFQLALVSYLATAAAAPLPALVLDPAQTTVSGLSSGGYMAVQLHIAYSATFAQGAGVIAGGPFDCAEDSVFTATGRCMRHGSPIPVAGLVRLTRDWAAHGKIDPLSNLARSRLYLFSGSKDSVVVPAVMDDLALYYQSFVPPANTVYKKDIAAEHAFVTDDYGNPCATKGSPYISNCGYDQAGALLQQLYGPLQPRQSGNLGGAFVEFDQEPYVSGHGMADRGWVYVPADCSARATCRLHVVLHGCEQNTASVGDTVVRHAGYNRWADSNRLVILYPQTGPGATNGCWDWWGYDSPSYAEKLGPQMKGIKAMVDRLGIGRPPAQLPAPTGVLAADATDTGMTLSWSPVGGAVGYRLYRGGELVNAGPLAGTRATDSGLSPGTAYSWTVSALDATQAEGPQSEPVSATTTGSPEVCITASNFDHVLAGRAYVFFGWTFAEGSNQSMGLWNIYVQTTLKQTGPKNYRVGTCP